MAERRKLEREKDVNDHVSLRLVVCLPTEVHW